MTLSTNARSVKDHAEAPGVLSGMGRGAVLVLLPLAFAALLVRTVAVLLLRRRWPAAAGAVERWWLWLPLVAVLVVVTVTEPLLGLLVTAVTVAVLVLAPGVGSPFRPR